jgi:hypothetical protein
MSLSSPDFGLNKFTYMDQYNKDKLDIIEKCKKQKELF